jgi:hypothetical protein
MLFRLEVSRLISLNISMLSAVFTGFGTYGDLDGSHYGTL